jgi:arginine/lysine/ornithine decarboxylase
MDKAVGQQAQNAMMLFGSTSPSYLILQSLDEANVYLQSYPARLQKLLPRLEAFKARLRKQGYTLYGSEALKLTIQAKPYGYTGNQLAECLRQQKIEPEFTDPDYVVLMLSCDMDLKPLEAALMELPKKEAILQAPPILPRPKAVLSVREAVMAPCEELPVEDCLGRTLADYGVNCPPAVPIVVCGEEISPESLACLEYYGVEKCRVVRDAD